MITAARIPARYFMHHPELHSYSAEASELRGFAWLGKVLSDRPHPPGFILNVDDRLPIPFFLERVEHAPDGEPVAWHFTTPDSSVTAVVFND